MKEVFVNPIISDIALDLGAWKLDQEWEEHETANSNILPVVSFRL